MIWHAIRVAPSAEFRVRDDLHRLSITALVPRQVVLRKVNRDGKKKPIFRPLLPGYVFAGFRDFPPWASLAGLRGWHGPVGFEGFPARLTTADVLAIQAFDRMPDEPVHRPCVKVGDKVPYRVGRLGELRAMVKRLEGAKVVLSVELFGSEREVTVASESIEAAA